jgi:dolichyl-diphosphooligosaccharide--protein glycosyltransferase/undecaprenyl-diphosphooligosaccharide--protein glycosyltransferase
VTFIKNNKTILFVIIAFVFSFTVRLIWIDHFNENESFKFNNEFMINTNDGYYYAEGARDVLDGKFIEDETNNDLSPVETATSRFTALLVYLLPISFETLIFYMPAFFGSLLVIPLILIGKSFDKENVGFVAALLGSITWSYYNRTMIGYYDTDLLNIVFPTFLLWSLIWALRTKEEKYILFTGLEIIAYRWWYPQSYALEFAFFGLLFLYFLYIHFKQKDNQNSQFILILLTFYMFAMVQIPDLVRLILVIVLFGILKLKKEYIIKYIYYLFGFAILLFMITGGLNPIIGKLAGYLDRGNDVIEQTLTVHFFSVMQTVREAGSIPFEIFANRISGSVLTFILAIVGYIWMTFRHKVMLLALPMVGLGFLAYGIPGLVPAGGLRFTIYAVPIMALGLAFLIVESSKFIVEQYLKDNAKNIVYYGVLTLATAAVLYPNIKHVYEYKVPTVFTNKEVVVLDKLKGIADREDYVVTWWDYGYPIRYYSDVKTLVDGGKHGGSVNFPVSFTLTQPQEVAAKMARFDVEYTEERFKVSKNNKDLDEKDSNFIKWQPSNIAQMTLDYGYKDTNNFLTALETDIKLPKKTRDIYIYLPNRMLNIYPTVTLFSNIDLMTGVKGNPPFFYKTTQFKEHKEFIDLGRGIKLSKKDGKLILGKKSTLISRFVKTVYDNKGKLRVQTQNIDFRSNYSVIFMQNYNQFLVVDEQTYQSLYFQLFVLENYDKELFEPTILTPLAKIYKLKI